VEDAQTQMIKLSALRFKKPLTSEFIIVLLQNYAERRDDNRLATSNAIIEKLARIITFRDAGDQAARRPGRARRAEKS
jgi:hypothetical protein